MDERDQIMLEGFNLGVSVGKEAGNPMQVLREVVAGSRTLVHGVADLRAMYGNAIPQEVYRQLTEKHPKLVENGQRQAAQVLRALEELGRV